MLFEPIPYRLAVREGATHVLVLRTRPDGVNVVRRQSIFERLIAWRFFERKMRMPHMYKHMRDQQHRQRYAEDILLLNEAAKQSQADSGIHIRWRSGPGPPEPVQLCQVALQPGERGPEVSNLQTDAGVTRSGRDRAEIVAAMGRPGASTHDAPPRHVHDTSTTRRRELFRASFGDFPPRDLSAPPSAAGPSTSAAPPPAGGAAKRAYATRLDEERTAAAEKEKRRRLHEQVLRDGPPWYGHLNPPPGHFNPPGPLPVNPGPGGGYPGGLPVPLPGFVGGDFDRTPGFGPLHGGAPGFGPPPGFPGVPAISHLRRRGSAPNFSRNLPV